MGALGQPLIAFYLVVAQFGLESRRDFGAVLFHFFDGSQPLLKSSIALDPRYLGQHSGGQGR
jgi:hypothetical protein